MRRRRKTNIGVEIKTSFEFRIELGKLNFQSQCGGVSPFYKDKSRELWTTGELVKCLHSEWGVPGGTLVAMAVNGKCVPAGAKSC